MQFIKRRTLVSLLLEINTTRFSEIEILFDTCFKLSLTLICCFVSWLDLKESCVSLCDVTLGMPLVGWLALGCDDALEFLSRSFRLSRVSSEI